jgi:myo-inositol 2-dehydrogenase/D-chiro-inositol 1-dehydrogenase
MITMRTDRDEIVSTEVYVNAAYGYHVHAELVVHHSDFDSLAVAG